MEGFAGNLEFERMERMWTGIGVSQCRGVSEEYVPKACTNRGKRLDWGMEETRAWNGQRAREASKDKKERTRSNLCVCARAERD